MDLDKLEQLFQLLERYPNIQCVKQDGMEIVARQQSINTSSTGFVKPKPKEPVAIADLQRKADSWAQGAK